MGTEGVGPSKGSEGRREGSGILRGERCSPKRRCDPGAQTGGREVPRNVYLGKTEALGSDSKK